MSKNIIRFYRKYSSTPAQLAGKDFEIDSISTDQGMFDKRTSEVSLTIDANLFKLFNGLSRDIEAQVTLSDGTIYVLSDLRQMNQTPVYDFYAGAYNKPGDKFNTRLTFGKWQVYLPHKDEICSVEPFDIGKHLESQAIATLSEQMEAWRNQLAEQIGVGLDLGQGDSQTATTIAEGDKFKSIKYQYTYTKRDVDKLFNEYKPNVYETDPSVYHSLWVDPSKVCTITIDNTDKKDFNDLSKKEAKELLQKTNKEKEKDIMKINDKDLKQIIIDEDRKTVTTITEEAGQFTKAFGLEPVKKVTVAKASDKDEFDPYVGVAMTLAYQLFGSKENFRKFVRENGLVKNLKKEREAREAAKKEAQEKAEEANKRAAAKRAKQAAKRAELRQAKLEATMDLLADALAERLTSKPKKTKKAKTEKSE